MSARNLGVEKIRKIMWEGMSMAFVSIGASLDINSGKFGNWLLGMLVRGIGLRRRAFWTASIIWIWGRVKKLVLAAERYCQFCVVAPS